MTIPFMKSDEELQDYVASFPPYLDPMEEVLPTFDQMVAAHEASERARLESMITRPAHYSVYAIEPIEYINKNRLGYNEGNIVKYISRHRMKNKAEDVRKAIKYCEFILRYEYGEEK
jgi:hypothetical protein